MAKHDTLQELPHGDVVKLRDFYSNGQPRIAYVYNFLNCVLRWNEKWKGDEFVKLLTPGRKVEDGTFVAVQEWSGYDVFIYTMNNNFEILYEMLRNTHNIDWKRLMVIYAVQKDQFPTILKVLEEVDFTMDHYNHYDVWWMPKEQALALKNDDVPAEIYIKDLHTNDAETINLQWDSRFPGSEKYLKTFIERNGGCGAFLRSNNQLVAWILRNQIGMGALETSGQHKRKGYASAVTKHLAKKIAEDGEDPVGTVSQGNTLSRALFEKLGFKIVESVVFVEAPIER